jgi:hypothetical protein
MSGFPAVQTGLGTSCARSGVSKAGVGGISPGMGPSALQHVVTLGGDQEMGPLVDMKHE